MGGKGLKGIIFFFLLLFITLLFYHLNSIVWDSFLVEDFLEDIFSFSVFYLVYISIITILSLISIDGTVILAIVVDHGYSMNLWVQVNSNVKGAVTSPRLR